MRYDDKRFGETFFVNSSGNSTSKINFLVLCGIGVSGNVLCKEFDKQINFSFEQCVVDSKKRYKKVAL